MLSKVFNLTKRQSRKLKRAWRERNITYLIKAVIFHIRLSHLIWFKRGGYKMRVFYTPFAFWLWSEKTERSHERSDEFFYKKLLRPGDIVVDAGANIGVCTLLSASITGESGHVYSFEPHLRTHRQLLGNIRLNNFKNITTFNTGLSNKREKVFFSDEYVSDINHVDKDRLENKTVSVYLDKVDDMLKEISDITLFKIDVEGYELFALQGATRILKETKIIYFESCPTSFKRFGYTQADIVLFLKGLGFDVYSLDDNLDLNPVDERYVTKSKYENLVVVKSKDLNFIKNRLS